MVKRPQKTAQRIAIFNYIKDHKSHPSVKDIYQHVSEKISCISLTTVYNTLELLKKEGLIIELPLPFHKEGRRFSSNLTPHDHLICHYCGSVTDIDIGFDRSFIHEEKNRAYDIKFVSLNVFGICTECKRQQEFELKEKMSRYQISTTLKDDILEIVVTGNLTNFTFEALIEEIIALEKTVNVKNELIDVRKLEGRFGYAEIFNLVKNYPPYKLKMNIAIVDIPANAQMGTFHTEIASKAGFNYQWFENIKAARALLKSR